MTPHDHLPLAPKTFAVLLALSEGRAHGYRLKQSIEERSGGSLRMDPGALYRTIARLVDDGWLKEVPAPSDENEDSRRRYYDLTGTGRSILAAEAARLATLVDVARALDIV